MAIGSLEQVLVKLGDLEGRLNSFCVDRDGRVYAYHHRVSSIAPNGSYSCSRCGEVAK